MTQLTKSGRYIRNKPRKGLCACGCGRYFITLWSNKIYATRLCAQRVANRLREKRRPVCGECGRKYPRGVKAKRNGRNRNGRNHGRSNGKS